MDANKRIKLQEIGYNIRRTCRNCTYSMINNIPWGTCTRFRYQHLKHSDSSREMSINMDGVCGSHEWSKTFLDSVGLFKEFLMNDKPVEMLRRCFQYLPDCPWRDDIRRYIEAHDIKKP